MRLSYGKSPNDCVDDECAAKFWVADFEGCHDPDPEKKPSCLDHPSVVAALHKVSLVVCHDRFLTWKDPRSC